MEFAEYPKMLYKDGGHLIVHTAEEETRASQDGYEAVEVDRPQVENCPACAALKARILELETQLAELEADTESEGEGTALDDLKARVAALEEKKAQGTMTKTEPALLGRLKKKLAELEAQA